MRVIAKAVAELVVGDFIDATTRVVSNEVLYSDKHRVTLDDGRGEYQLILRGDVIM